MVYWWFERFDSGAKSTEDEQRSGCSSTSTTDENVSIINEMIGENRRLTFREISTSTTDENVSIINEMIRENRRSTFREISNALNIEFGSV
jgi:hypothetical protein